MIRIGSDTDIGMNRNSSDWLGMNSYPILFPGLLKKPRFLANKRDNIFNGFEISISFILEQVI